MSTSLSKTFIESLKAASSDVDVYVKSTDSSVSVKPLTLNQQKLLVSTAVEGVAGILNFAIHQNAIISNNTSLSDLYTYDKTPIISKLRAESLGATVTIDDVEVDLGEVEKNSREYKTTFKHKESISIGDIKLNLRIPTIKEEDSILKKCVQELEKHRNDDAKMVELIYIFELAKYVESIEVGEEVVLFSDIRIIDRVKAIESLPLSFYNKVTQFVKQITDHETNILTVGESLISINAAFFDTTSAE